MLSRVKRGCGGAWVVTKKVAARVMGVIHYIDPVTGPITRALAGMTLFANWTNRFGFRARACAHPGTAPTDRSVMAAYIATMSVGTALLFFDFLVSFPELLQRMLRLQAAPDAFKLRQQYNRIYVTFSGAAAGAGLGYFAFRESGNDEYAGEECEGYVALIGFLSLGFAAWACYANRITELPLNQQNSANLLALYRAKLAARGENFSSPRSAGVAGSVSSSTHEDSFARAGVLRRVQTRLKTASSRAGRYIDRRPKLKSVARGVGHLISVGTAFGLGILVDDVFNLYGLNSFDRVSVEESLSLGALFGGLEVIRIFYDGSKVTEWVQRTQALFVGYALAIQAIHVFIILGSSAHKNKLTLPYADQGRHAPRWFIGLVNGLAVTVSLVALVRLVFPHSGEEDHELQEHFRKERDEGDVQTVIQLTRVSVNQNNGGVLESAVERGTPIPPCTPRSGVGAGSTESSSPPSDGNGSPGSFAPGRQPGSP